MKARTEGRALLNFSVAITCYSVLFFFTTLWADRVVVFRDLLTFVLPMEVAGKNLSSFSWPPLWNPWQGLGKPFLADIVMGALYPPSFLTHLFHEPIGFNIDIILHHVIAAVGMYVFLRAVRLDYLPASFGAFLISFGGIGISADNMFNALRSMSWLPWVFWAYAKMRTQPKARWVVALSVFLGLIVLGGFPEPGLLAVGAIFAALVLSPGALGRANQMRRLVLALAITGAGFAVQLLPFLDLVSHSSRASGLQASTVLQYSLNPSSLLNILIPRIYNVGGNHLNPAPSLVTGELDVAPWAVSIFFGSAFLLLPWGRKVFSDRVSGYWLLALLLSVTLAFGRNLPGATSLVEHFSLFRLIRYPEKFLVLTNFLLCVALATGMQGLIRVPARMNYFAASACLLTILAYFLMNSTGGIFTPMAQSQATKVFVFALASAVCGILAWPNRLTGAALIALLSVVQISMSHWELFPSVTWRELVATPEFLRFAHWGQDPARIYSNQAQVPFFDDVQAQVAMHRELMSHSLSQLHGIDNINAPASLNVQSLEELENVLESQSPERRAQFLGELNARYVLSLVPLVNPGLTLLNASAPPANPKLYEVEHVAPRVSFAKSVRCLNGQEEILNVIRSQGLDNSILVAASDVGQVCSALTSDGDATLEYYSPQRVEVVFSKSENVRLLVVRDAYDEDWQARSPQGPLPIIRANYFMRAVVVPPGIENVTMAYHPKSFCLGVGLSVATWAMVGFWLFRSRRKAPSAAGAARG